MRRILPTVAVCALPALAVAGPVPFALQENAAQAAAINYAADLCRQPSPSCTEAKSLLENYLSALTAATICDAGECTLDQISAQAKALAEFDRRDGALPPGGRLDRPFLALSAIASSRLTDAATRLGRPYAAVVCGPDDRTIAQKDVEGFCLDAPAACLEMRGALTTGDEVRARLAACAAAACTLEQVDPIVETARQAMSVSFRLSNLSKAGILGIFVSLNDARNRAIAAYSPLADQAAADLSQGVDELGAKLDLATMDAAVPLADVDAAGRDLFERQRRAALAADRLAYHLGYHGNTGVPTRRAAVNAATIKLSGLRSRALALRTARGLDDAKTDAGALGAGSPEAGWTKGRRTPTRPPPQRSIIDRSLIPNPAPLTGSAPPIVPGDPSLIQLLRNIGSPDPVVNADALRRFRQTQTVGDPRRYAAVAFSQKDGSSCAVAAQAQVLQVHGLLPPGETASTQEQALIDEARRLGYMEDGTPPEYSGSLLVERGMLVVKSRGYDHAALTAAVKRGGLVQVNVDADVFWGMNTGNMASHSVLITGAEVAKSDGRILGVYVNDTGTTPPGAGNFIPWSKFLKSWLGNYAEVR